MLADELSSKQTSIPVHSSRAVYIHIPFCTNKCYYCDFNSYVLQGQPVMEYLWAMEQEMAYTVKQNPPGVIDTIFIGGGTPTVLTPTQMSYFLESVRKAFPNWSPSIEFSMEANPGTTDLDKLQVMHAKGVNRLSFGVQSFDNNLLCGIGRIHNVDDVYRNIDHARTAGFSNISIDLMFGLPNQTIEMLDRSVTEALKLNLPHLSVYSLKVEENTLFHTMYQRNELPLPSEEEELDMYMLIRERLKAAGYEQYEISNFAKPGYESRHNTVYWRNEEYYGIGAGAHGYVNRERHVNIKGVNPYIQACKQGLPKLNTFSIEESEAMEDFMMVGLRLLEGVSSTRFASQFNGALLDKVFSVPLRRLLKQGMVTTTEDGYRLTEQGLLFGNHVFGEFIGTLTNK